MKLQPFPIDPITAKYRGRDLEAIRSFAEHHELSLPAHVEIGSNRGRFLRGIAELHPDVSVVGIEYRRAWAALAEREGQRSGPPNAYVLSADALLAIPLLFADGMIARIYVLFPDPWWKKRHAKRRMISPSFLDLAARKIGPGGLLLIKTDVAPYRDYVAELMSEVATFEPITDVDDSYPADETQWPLTTRERNIVREGLPIYRLYFRRTQVDADVVAIAATAAVRFPKPQ